MPSARFFNRTATLVPASYPQDAAGGEVVTPAPEPAAVPCAVQQDAGPTPDEGQKARRSTAAIRLFFPADPGLKVNDQVRVDGHTYRLDGPAFDASGRGAVFEATAVEVR